MVLFCWIFPSAVRRDQSLAHPGGWSGESREAGKGGSSANMISAPEGRHRTNVACAKFSVDSKDAPHRVASFSSCRPENMPQPRLRCAAPLGLDLL